LLVGVEVGKGDGIGEGGLVGTALGPLAFTLVGAGVTGTAMIVDGAALGATVILSKQ